MSDRAESFPLHRREVAKKILDANDETLIVTGLGSTNWDFTAAGDCERIFPLWGAMGGCAGMGLGLALAQPGRRVIAATGDGEMLMGIGTLATIAVKAPKNLTICIMDNERYGETGMQETHTATVTDLEMTAKGMGIQNVGTIRSEDDLAAQMDEIISGDGPVFRVIKVQAEPLPFILPSKDGVHLKNRMRRYLLGDSAL